MPKPVRRASAASHLSTSRFDGYQDVRRQQIEAPWLGAPMPIILNCQEAPGDTIMSTIVTGSLHRQYPGRFLTDLRGQEAEAVYRHSPYQTALPEDTKVIAFNHLKLAEGNGNFLHFAESTCAYVGDQLGVLLSPQINRPEFFLTADEKATRLLQRPYALLFAARKDRDCQTKWYPRWPAVVEMLRARYPNVAIVQVGAAQDYNPHIPGMVDMVGRWDNDFRGLMVAANRAEFGLGAISMSLWLMSGLGRPYVCVATGYESRTWAWQPVDYVGPAPVKCCAGGAGCGRRKYAECGTNLRGDDLPACLDLPPQDIVAKVDAHVRAGNVHLGGITVGTLYTPEMAGLGEQTAAVLAKYADRHGYQVVVGTQQILPDRPPAWSKLPFISRYLRAHRECEWFLWVDADAVVMNHETLVEGLIDQDYDVIVGDNEPYYAFNAGVMLFRNRQAVWWYLEAAAKYDPKTGLCAKAGLWDQGALIDMADMVRLKIVRRRRMQSFTNRIESDYEPGDWIQHFSTQPKPAKITVPGVYP